MRLVGKRGGKLISLMVFIMLHIYGNLGLTCVGSSGPHGRNKTRAPRASWNQLSIKTLQWRLSYTKFSEAFISTRTEMTALLAFQKYSRLLIEASQVNAVAVCWVVTTTFLDVINWSTIIAIWNIIVVKVGAKQGSIQWLEKKSSVRE